MADLIQLMAAKLGISPDRSKDAIITIAHPSCLRKFYSIHFITFSTHSQS
ncbi:MAG: hypothetical protein JWR38_2502 [Mucilaginibacter sp.]|nr:hypothetical protein [Mucilaginibacter sp.]